MNRQNDFGDERGARLSYYQEILKEDEVKKLSNLKNRRPIEPDSHPKNAGKRWTYHEDCLLRNMYDFGGSAEAISNVLGRTICGAASRLRRLGVISERQEFYDRSSQVS